MIWRCAIYLRGILSLVVPMQELDVARHNLLGILFYSVAIVSGQDLN